MQFAPDFFNSAKSTSSSPFSPFDTDAYGRTLHKLTFLAVSIIFAKQ